MRLGVGGKVTDAKATDAVPGILLTILVMIIIIGLVSKLPTAPNDEDSILPNVDSAK